MTDLVAVSGKQFAGKDLLADFLHDALPEFTKLPLARAIKLEFADLYGLTPQAIEANKALYRPGLIVLGQRRRKQNPDYWLKKVLQYPGPKIISDLRLCHEYEVLREHGAFCIRVEADRDVRAKRGNLVKEDDITERDLDRVTDWDAVIINNGSPEELREKALALAQRIRAQDPA